MARDSDSMLDLRSVIVTVAVLLVGAVVGFGVGYRYEKHSTAVAASSAKAKGTSATTTNEGSTSASSNGQKIKLVLVACMAKDGVKYPSGTTDISKPPPGVSDTTYRAALTTCTKALVANPKG